MILSCVLVALSNHALIIPRVWTSKLKDHLLLAVRECLFNIFLAILRVERRAVVTGALLTWRELFTNSSDTKLNSFYPDLKNAESRYVRRVSSPPAICKTSDGGSPCHSVMPCITADLVSCSAGYMARLQGYYCTMGFLPATMWGRGWTRFCYTYATWSNLLARSSGPPNQGYYILSS
jgi:hypothetical protein